MTKNSLRKDFTLLIFAPLFIASNIAMASEVCGNISTAGSTTVNSINCGITIQASAVSNTLSAVVAVSTTTSNLPASTLTAQVVSPAVPPSSPVANQSGGSGGGGGGMSMNSSSATQGDTNGDHIVNLIDFNTLIIGWGTKGQNLLADFNRDELVDILDFNILIINWTL